MPKYIEVAYLENLLKDRERCGYLDAGDIYNAPAADVQPVVHGWWVEIGRNSHDYETSIEEKCSLCGRYVYRYDTQPQDNYCPNCGARMEDEP